MLKDNAPKDNTTFLIMVSMSNIVEYAIAHKISITHAYNDFRKLNDTLTEAKLALPIVPDGTVGMTI